MTNVQELIRELPGDAEVISLPVVRQIISERLGPWSANAQCLAIKSGAITVLDNAPTFGSNAKKVTRSEAVLILAAAVLASMSGGTVGSTLSMIKLSGVDPAVFIAAAGDPRPLPAPPVRSAAGPRRNRKAEKNDLRKRQQAHQRAAEKARNKAAQKAAQTT